ncbi:MAG: prepilin-type N-terminal cleavage/methylation domain-containing protein [Gammaproteobacteria bacterium]|nr:MAG: prepilin-type N-terminal cleavage/methylation domain-containing protein [Gammaproteobacteria bacterium]
MMRTASKHSTIRQRGLSLVEIMVALALGAVITVGIVQMFTANRATYQVNMGQARLQENARFGIEFLASPLRAAGAAGCARRVPIENLLGAEGAPGARFDLDEAIVGHTGSGGTWNPTLPTTVFTGVSPTADQDVLLVKYLHSEALDVVSTSDSNIVVTLPAVASIYAGAPLVVSDCERAILFESDTASLSGGQLDISHTLGVDPDFGPEATVSRVYSDYFYVAPGAGTNNAGAAPLSLWRHRPGEGHTELVEGVGELSFRYGVDLNGDRVPNTYRDSMTAADDVVTVRINLTANSVDVITEDGDVSTRDFTQTVGVRNRL